MLCKQKSKQILKRTRQRSLLMAKVRQEGSAPEQTVRNMLVELGLPFKINGKALPGSPDIYRPGLQCALFIHGCFWHRHRGCSAATTPKTNQAFWKKKFTANVARDKRKSSQLRRLGYRVLTVWECQIESEQRRERIRNRLNLFFRGAN